MRRPRSRASPASGGSASSTRSPTSRRRDDLARLSAELMAIVARSARVADGNEDPVAGETVAQGKSAAEKFLLRWRGEADPAHVKAIDTYWICTAEHGLNASTFTARIAASTGADAGAAMSAAVGTLSGPLHGGAPAHVDADDRRGRGDGRPGAMGLGAPRSRRPDHGLRASRVPGGGSARAAAVADSGRARLARVETAKALEEAALAELGRRHPERVLATNVEYWAAVVLDVAQIPAKLTPAMFACARVAGWSAHILEQKRVGPPDPAGGAVRRAARPLAVRHFDDARRCGGRGRRARAGRGRALARGAARPVGRGDRGGGAGRGLPRALAGLPRDRPVPLPAEAPAPAARARGREPGGSRLGVDRAGGALAWPSRRRQLVPAARSTISPRATRTSRFAAWPSSA